MNKGRKTTFLRVISVLAAVIVLAGMILCTPFGLIALSTLEIHRLENRMQRPEICQEVATNLALYCQSADLLHITDNVEVARLPQPIPQLGSPWGTIRSDFARVEFGGGFYHFGYLMELDEQNSGHGSNVWQLFLEREELPPKLLQTVILPKKARIPLAAFLSNSLAEYDARLARTPHDLELHQAKITFLLQYEPSAVRAACTDAIAAMPDHWWPRLTLALLDTGAGHFTEASSNLVKFVESKPSYSRYTYLAYFYQVTQKPHETALAIQKAISFPVVDLNDDLNNTECRGYSLGVYLFKNGEYSTVIRLCDVLLPIKVNGDYAKAALSGLKGAAQTALNGRKPEFHCNESVLGFNPYEGFDVHALMSP